MNARRRFSLFALGRLVSVIVLMALSAAGANAVPVQYSSRATFESQGTIAENYGFEDWGSTGGFAFPGDPYTAHGVTYETGSNLIVLPDSGYGNASNVIAYNGWTPLPASIGGAYDMLGFDLAILGSTSTIDFSLTTNMAVYSFFDVVVPNVNTGMDFFGFIADPGEQFTGMNFASDGGIGYAPVLDNVTLGTAVPEPASVLLLGLGLAGLGFSRRGTKSA